MIQPIITDGSLCCDFEKGTLRIRWNDQTGWNRASKTRKSNEQLKNLGVSKYPDHVGVVRTDCDGGYLSKEE